MYFNIKTMETKECSKCGEFKILNKFSLKTVAKDRLSCICKECHKQYRRDHYLKNKEKVINQVNNYHKIYPKSSRRVVCEKKSGRTNASECARCGIVIYVTKKELKEDKKRYCSRECYNISKRRPFKYHADNIYKAAIIRSKEYDLDEAFLIDLFNKQQGRCAITNVSLTIYGRGKRSNLVDAASLDRIDSNIGYLKNNVQWVLLGINYMKRNFKEDDLFILLDKIVENYKRK